MSGRSITASKRIKQFKLHDFELQLEEFDKSTAGALAKIRATWPNEGADQFVAAIESGRAVLESKAARLSQYVTENHEILKILTSARGGAAPLAFTGLFIAVVEACNQAKSHGMKWQNGAQDPARTLLHQEHEFQKAALAAAKQIRAAGKFFDVGSYKSRSQSTLHKAIGQMPSGVVIFGGAENIRAGIVPSFFSKLADQIEFDAIPHREKSHIQVGNLLLPRTMSEPGRIIGQPQIGLAFELVFLFRCFSATARTNEESSFDSFDYSGEPMPEFGQPHYRVTSEILAEVLNTQWSSDETRKRIVNLTKGRSETESVLLTTWSK